eukprot:m.3553 g.3553  ORF g.3553 m.3553 type:complete len:130 (+) comp9532_c0_seq1:57-446(+)
MAYSYFLQILTLASLMAFSSSLTCYSCGSFTQSDTCSAEVKNGTQVSNCSSGETYCKTTLSGSIYARSCESSCTEEDVCVGISILKVCTKTACCDDNNCNGNFNSAASLAASLAMILVCIAVAMVTGSG